MPAHHHHDDHHHDDHHHDHSPNETLHVHDHDHGHTHDHVHPGDHSHEHTHGHTHEHDHADGKAHSHEHAHAHDHEHAHGSEHVHDAHDGLLKSKAEAAAFLQYTLHHNAHHDEELSGLVHSLQHLALTKEAAEIASCIGTLKDVNARLETVLAALK